MRVLVAPDCFTGTLTAVEAAQAVAAGWRRVAPHDHLDLAPLSDGGPGLVAVLAAALPHARTQPVVARDPLGRPVPATVLLVPEPDVLTAYVESAQACGLALLAPGERDPRTTSTYGVADLVRAAVAAGARRVVVGLGGSGTQDGGAGLLAGLGVTAHDAHGRVLPPGGAALVDVAALRGAVDLPPDVVLVAAGDVDVVLLGLHGSAALFGPQKGADADAVQLLDRALGCWADALETWAGRAVRDLPGAGAAGGLGAALAALGAERAPGLPTVTDLLDLPARVTAADLVLTGEGCLDPTSLRGKVVHGVAALALEAAVPCLVLAGSVEVGRREAAAHGVEAAYSVVELVGRERAFAEPAAALADLAATVAGTWSPGARTRRDGPGTTA